MDTPTDFDAVELFHDSPEPMLVYDPDTLGILAVNKAAIAQYGYSQEEFLAMTIADMRPAEDIDTLRTIVRLATGYSTPSFARHKHKSGKLLYVEVSSRAITFRRHAARLVTIRDTRGRVDTTSSQSAAQSRLCMAKWELDVALDKATWSPSVYEIFGLDPLLWNNTRENFLKLLHPDDRDNYRRAQNEAIRTGQIFELQYRAQHASGSEIVLHEVAEVLRISDRLIFSAVIQDITEFVNARTDSARLEARLGEVIEGMSDAFCLLDREWKFRYLNHNAEVLLNRERSSLVGRVLWEEFPSLLGTPFESILQDASARRTSRRITAPYGSEGTSFEMAVHSGCEDLAVYFRDVTEEEREAAQRKLINAAISRLNDVVLITEADSAPGNPRNKIIYANEAVRRLTGYGPEELIGQTPHILHGPRTQGPALDKLNDAIRTRSAVRVDLLNYKRQGIPYWVEINLSPVRNKAGACTHFIAVERDITHRKKTERALRLAATRDALTNLPNRSGFKDNLERELATAQEHKGTLALLFIDIDHFKDINDTMGHKAGDDLLSAVARRIYRVVRQVDHLARFGGDEFVILAPGADLATAKSLAERLVQAFLEPFYLNQEWISLTTSIGIAIAPEDGSDADELIRNADIAMYRSKASGRNQATKFDQELHQNMLRNVGTTQALQKALTIGDGFSLVFQPQFTLDSEPQLVGTEALLRWQHPTRGSVSPAEFIPVAEKAGLIRMLDCHVIEMAARQIADWNQHGKCIPVSINISANTLQWEGLADFILEKLNVHSVPAQFFGIEILETLMLETSRETIGNLLELRRAGICIAIDDFGTGHSSLSYLQDLPVDIIKIDQSFVHRLENDEGREAALIKAILAMAKALKLVVIAEGVETEAQRSWLTSNDCQAIQGFLVGRPIPPETFASKYFVDSDKLPKVDLVCGATSSR